MPFWRERIPLGKERDARRKLSDKDKKNIRRLYSTGKWSQRKLAKKYGVSRRLIIFIVFPERLEENIKKRKERGGWKQYYNKDKHCLYMKKHRDRKQKLITPEEYKPPVKKEGEIKCQQKKKGPWT